MTGVQTCALPIYDDLLCLEAHLGNTSPVQEKTMEVDDSLLEDYVGKHSDEDL